VCPLVLIRATRCNIPGNFKFGLHVCPLGGMWKGKETLWGWFWKGWRGKHSVGARVECAGIICVDRKETTWPPTWGSIFRSHLEGLQWQTGLSDSEQEEHIPPLITRLTAWNLFSISLAGILLTLSLLGVKRKSVEELKGLWGFACSGKYCAPCVTAVKKVLI
jgi:hypothetical protein